MSQEIPPPTPLGSREATLIQGGVMYPCVILTSEEGSE